MKGCRLADESQVKQSLGLFMAEINKVSLFLTVDLLLLSRQKTITHNIDDINSRISPDCVITTFTQLVSSAGFLRIF